MCEYCQREFAKNFELKSHLLLHTSEATIKCLLEDCDKMFHEAAKMRQHIKTVHLNISKCVPCTYAGCSKSFKSNSLMNYHMKFTHFKVRKYPCPNCSRGK